MDNYGTRLIRDLPEQFKDGKRTTALLTAIGRQMDEIYEFYSQLNLQRALSTAYGAQLDAIGEILVLSRKDASTINGRDEDHEMDDTDYRAALGYKIMLNYGDATYYDIVRGIKNFCSTYPIRYSEDKDFPATFFLEIEVEEDSPVILRNLLPVRAAGVDCEYQFRMSLYIEVSSDVSLYPYSVPECGKYRCGTYPSKSTLGNTQDMSIAVSGTAEVIPYEPVFTGTVPDTATNGYTGISIAEVSTATNSIVYTSGFSGNDTCGENPTPATTGYAYTADIDTGGYGQVYRYDSEPCGSKQCGE